MKKTLIKTILQMTFYLFWVIRIACVPLLLATSCAWATGQSLSSTKVTLQVENASFDEVMELIEHKTNFDFYYAAKHLPLDNRISLSVKKESLRKVLSTIARQMHVDFRRIEKRIYVYPSTSSLSIRTEKENENIELITREERRITGKVTDAKSGETLAGATVQVKGTFIGVVSDVNGEFIINLPENANTIIISFVGYQTQEVLISNQTNLNIQLQEDVSSLEDIVVIGYDNRLKKDLTTSISSLQSESIKDQAIAGFDQALIGLLPGVQVSLTSGAPGSNGRIKIRGIGTLTAGIEPLIVLDGVPLAEGANLSIINPADIESIDILKDASAAAIYGSRGGNGVLLITTKKGKTNSLKPRINLDIYGGIQEVSRTIDLMDAYEMAQYVAASRNNAWVNLDPENNSANDPNEIRTGRYQIPEYIQPYLDGTPALTNTDWQDAIFRTAPMQNYQVSVSGGGEKVQYYFSGNYFNQKGIIENTDFERYNLRANITGNITDRLQFGLNFMPSFSQSNLTNPGGHWQNGVIIGTFFAQPFFEVYGEDGNFDLTEQLGAVIADQQFRRAVQNPVAIANMEERIQDEFRLIGGVHLDYELLDGLTFRTSWGLDLLDRKLDFFRPAALGFYNNLPPAISLGSLDNFRSLNWLTENTLTFKRSFGGIHNLTVLAGYTYQQADFDISRIVANDFPNDDIRTLNAGNIIVDDTYSRESKWILLSYLSRVSYDFKGKYFVSASIRRDGSSRFGDDSKFGVFPAFSAAWKVSKEGFMSNINFIYDLKIRGSWGITGNNQIGNFASKSLLTETNYILGDQLVNGLSPATLPNDELSWETTKMLDIGIDAAFLENKLYFTVDYYQSTTDDLLLNVPVPASSGYTSSISNFGEVENKGIEFLLGTQLEIGNLKIRSSFNISHNRNEVISLGPDQEQLIDGGVFITKVGEPISSYYGYVVNGVFTSEAQLEATPHHPNAKVGSYIYADVNEDGEINASDRTIIGNPWPDYTFGFNSSFEFKGVDLSFTLQGVQGYDVYLNNAFTYFNHEAWTNMHRDLLQGINDPMNSEYAWPNIDPGESLWQSSTQKFADASYIRLRTLTLGYSLPAGLISKIGLERARVYITGQNLFTITSYPGYNPEVDDENSTLQIGKAWSEYPLPRSVIFGVNVSF